MRNINFEKFLNSGGEKMKIGIDGNLLCGKKTGMGTVVYHVLENYDNRMKDTDIILYVPEKLSEEYTEILEQNGITVKVLKKSNYMIWEQVVLGKQIKKDKLDVFWFPYNTATIRVACKSIVTINDVIYMKNPLLAPPTLYKKVGQLYRKIFVPIAARKAQRIITISEYAKNEIVSVFQNVSDKIKVIYLSAENGRSKLNAEVWEEYKQKNGITDRYILGFGSLEKRKNSLQLIKSYEALPDDYRKSYQLVLFGFRGWEQSDEYIYIKEHNLGNVIMLGYVSNEEKNSLYSNSKMFVFPSLSEGFGIPVLEAFANDTPVVTSITTSLPEVAGDAAILVDPQDEKAILEAMKKLLDDSALCSDLKVKGKNQYDRFDWKITAEKIMNTLIEEI